VHVLKGDGLAVITLEYLGETQALRRVEGMNRADVARAMRLVRDNSEVLIARWREIHG
jgi:hypothetical protein